MTAQTEGVAVLHLQFILADAVETAEHAKGLLVADDLNAGIVFSDERDRTAVVGFHVVDDKVVDGAVADHLMDVLEKLGEEINYRRGIPSHHQ